MKKPTLIIIGLAFGCISVAQAPAAFKYQAVARDATGAVMANKSVSFRIHIVQGTVTGAIVYTERHNTNTNEYGLVNLEIGKGTVGMGTFSGINWGVDEHFLKVEMDPNGGNSFHLMGTSQLLSVPYALHAKTVENDLVNDADADPGNELQELQLAGNNLSLTRGGGTVTLPGGADNWGSQVVATDYTLTGNGTAGSPLQVANNAITSAKIADNSIVTADLTDNSVTNSKIINTAVSTDKLANSAVTAPKLASMGASSGQVLKYNGTAWGPAADASGLSLPYYETISHDDYAIKITNSNKSAIYGYSSGTSSSTFGLYGRNDAPGGRGVWGYASATTGASVGVGGGTASSSGTAISGLATSTTGTTYGLYSEVNSPNGFAGYFKGGKVYVEGKLGVGDTSPDADLDVEGEVKIGNAGLNFLEIRQVTGTTSSTGFATTISYPTGYNKANTRVLAYEVYTGVIWSGLGTVFPGKSSSISCSLRTSDILLTVPDYDSYYNRSFRLVLMRVAD